MEWYFPESMEELLKLLSDVKGLKLHGGGTMLLRLMRGGDTIRVASLSKLPLDGVEINGEDIEIGAANTYSRAVSKIDGLIANDGKKQFSCLLCAALGRAASTPIRNRITIGGGVASLPPWSDLIAPLYILDAKVVLSGKNSGEYDFTNFFTDTKKLLSNSVITSIRIPVKILERKFSYHRETRVAFDYPAFTIAVNADIKNSTVNDIRISVSGVTERVVRLNDIENFIKGKSTDIMKQRGLAKDVPFNFGRKPAGGPEYLAHAARVEVERALHEIAGGE
ncbi:MAG: FAD binding domain-containing protein [Synergistaceae bacterium]|nr:FAD binding domain-containing protein [Synergistaceae bacterium]